MPDVGRLKLDVSLKVTQQDPVAIMNTSKP